MTRPIIVGLDPEWLLRKLAQRGVYCRATTSKLADGFRRQTMKSPLGDLFVYSFPRLPSARIEFGTWPKLAEQQNRAQRPESSGRSYKWFMHCKTEFALLECDTEWRRHCKLIISSPKVDAVSQNEQSSRDEQLRFPPWGTGGCSDIAVPCCTSESYSLHDARSRQLLIPGPIWCR